MADRVHCVPPRAWSAAPWAEAGAPASTLFPLADILHPLSLCCSSYLESAAHAEDTVVGLLGGKALESQLNSLRLLGDQVVGSAERKALDMVGRGVRSGTWRASSRPLVATDGGHTSGRACGSRRAAMRDGSAGGAGGAGADDGTYVGVPVGERLEPPAQPGALDDEAGERRGAHCDDAARAGVGVEMRACSRLCGW